MVAELVLNESAEDKTLGAPVVLQSVQSLVNRVVEEISSSFNSATAPAAEAAAAEAFSAGASPAGTGGADESAPGGSLDGDRGEDLGEGGTYSALRRDAFVVLRALCKLSMKPPADTPAADAVVEKGKLLSLHLVRILGMDRAQQVALLLR